MWRMVRFASESLKVLSFPTVLPHEISTYVTLPLLREGEDGGAHMDLIGFLYRFPVRDNLVLELRKVRGVPLMGTSLANDTGLG
jgi:hypothetical protein